MSTRKPRPAPQPFYSIEDVKRRNERAGLYWFSPATMRFFRSRVGDRVHPAADVCFFVSSECDHRNEDRRYTVRVCNADGSIDTIGDFRAYPTSAAAHRAAKNAADTYNAEHGATFRRRMRAHDRKEAAARAERLARWEALRANACTA